MNRVVACSARQVRLGRMVRRSESQFKVNDRAFPIRVKFVVPPGGMRNLEVGISVHEWLQRELGPSGLGLGSSPFDRVPCNGLLPSLAG